jgi:BON domain
MRRHAIGLATILAASLLIAGCSGTRRDQSITTEIQAKLFSDPQVKNANLDVSTKDGVVTLSGSVPGEAARYEAFKVATETSGVTKVVDQMSVAQAQAATAPTPEPASAAAPERKLAPPRPRTRSAERRRVAVRERKSRSAQQAAPLQASTEPTAADSTSASAADAASLPPTETAPTPAAQTADNVPPVPADAAPHQPPEPQIRKVEIPAGTSIRIQMIDSVDSSVNHVGDTFHASLAAPIVVGNEVVVPNGTDIYVRLVNASSAGRIAGRSELGLELDRMEYQGQVYPLVSNEYQQVGKSRGTNTAEKVGAGAAIGALLGAIIGRGKGAAIGATVGAGAGTAAQVATHGQQVRIPSETKLDFVLQQPITVSGAAGQSSTP